MKTIRQLLDSYQERIGRNECIWLLEDVLSTSSAKMMDRLDHPLESEDIDTFCTIADRVASGYPIQYALKLWDFAGMSIHTDERALIPRPETELLALQCVQTLHSMISPHVVDLGCGSGCIGLYIKSKRPDAQVTLCDLSPDAIALSRENARMLELDVRLLCMDMAQIEGSYDVIVSNPPYITQDEMCALDESVREYEPHSALYGGEDGLDYYRMLSGMHDRLNAGGWLLMEIGWQQGPAVTAMLETHYTDITVVQDLAGHDRIVMARKR